MDIEPQFKSLSTIYTVVRICMSATDDLYFLPAALRAAQICRYLVYSEADFEVFRPAGTTGCTEGGEIWHG